MVLNTIYEEDDNVCELVRTDSTTLGSNGKVRLSPLGRERRINRLNMKLINAIKNNEYFI